MAELLAHIREVRDFQRALERSGRREAIFDLIVDHLTRMIGAEPQTGYRPPTPAGTSPAQARPASSPHRVLNVQA